MEDGPLLDSVDCSRSYSYLLLEQKGEEFPRGEIVQKLKNVEKYRKYRLPLTDETVQYIGADASLAPLTMKECFVLDGIESPGDRYSVYSTPGKLAWGAELKLGDTVLVDNWNWSTRSRLSTDAVIRWCGRSAPDMRYCFKVQSFDKEMVLGDSYSFDLTKLWPAKINYQPLTAHQPELLSAERNGQDSRRLHEKEVREQESRLQEDVKEKEVTIGRLQKEMREQEARLQEEVREKEVTIGRLQEEMRKQEARLQEEVKEKEVTIGRLQEEMREQEAILQEKAVAISRLQEDRREQEARLQEKAREKEATISRLQKEMREKEVTIGRLQDVKESTTTTLTHRKTTELQDGLEATNRSHGEARETKHEKLKQNMTDRKTASTTTPIFYCAVAISLGFLAIAMITLPFLKTPAPEVPIPSPTLPPCQQVDRDSAEAIEIRHLQLLDYMDAGEKKQLRLLEEIAGKWDKLAIQFKYDDEQIRMNNGQAVDCCREVMKRWLDENGATSGYPTSWNGLIKALKDIQLNRQANKLEKALKCALL